MAVLTGSVAAANSVRQVRPGILPGIDKAVFAQMLPVKAGHPAGISRPRSVKQDENNNEPVQGKGEENVTTENEGSFHQESFEESADSLPDGGKAGDEQRETEANAIAGKMKILWVNLQQ